MLIGARFLAGLIALAALSSAQAADTIRLAQNLSPISGVTIVAKARGLFEKHGLDVQVSNFSSGRQALETVMAGGAEIATTAEAPVTAAAMAGQPIAFLARTEYSDLKSVTSTPGLRELSDLKGRKLGYTSGTGSEVYTLGVLARAGLKPQDVTLVNLRPQDMAPALAQGSIDVMNTWEPHIANARRLLADKAHVLPTAGVYAETFNIVTTRDYLAKHEAAATRFLQALVEADEWIAAHPDEAIQVISEAVGMPGAELKGIFSDYVYRVVLDDRTMAVLQAHAQWRLDSGNAPSGAKLPDFAAVVFPGPLRAVDPGRVTAAGLE